MRPPLDRELVFLLLEEMEIVLAAHQLWLKRFNHALLFGDGTLAAYDRPDAHLHPLFGKWQNPMGIDEIREHPEVAAIVQIQREIQETATRLCLDQSQFGRITEEDYDHCMSLSVHLNTQLRSLQLEIIAEFLTTDPLTGAFGRRGMLDKLASEMERAARVGSSCSIALMDFDHFKQINDQRGHAAGDAALRQSAKFTMSRLRKYDSLYRHGGEEFLILLPDTPLPDAVAIVERLRAGLAELDIVPPDGEPFRITASFGVAALESGRPVEASIEAADCALYRAKAAGRNTVESGLEQLLEMCAEGAL